ncbi:MAG: hypothetical protein D6683_07185 [Actinomyces sp.]|nr:MAG: hypothetical protein D6683_07185 [Actinomyces sp.]
MVTVDAESFRISLHLLGVAVWIGGQLVVAALVPVLRSLGEDAPRRAARRFGQVAWPFFALTVVTGIWNLFEVDLDTVDTSYNVTLGLKLLLVAASGTAAAVHSLTDSPALRGITGAGALVAGLGALYCGVLLVV